MGVRTFGYFCRRCMRTGCADLGEPHCITCMKELAEESKRGQLSLPDEDDISGYHFTLPDAVGRAHPVWPGFFMTAIIVVAGCLARSC